MNAQQTELDRLGVVQDSDREGVARAREAGALAAKITGAGCGGTLFSLVTESSRDAVLEAWGPTALHARVGTRD
jgi:mevalonate kinase